ncbi:MAG TPA: DUF1704 domain-containing protein, partial [Candidatus Moranbacteria bacterium]|nr:DUF1704 domain-containing protein [Candidatus Moranbacteria bacterium]
WFERFSRAGSFEDYDYLEGEKKYREQERKKFLEEAARNPNLGYPKLENLDFAGKEKELLDLKKEILEKESSDAVKKAYRWKLNEKIAQLRMLKASKDGDDKKFAKYSRFIYGMPEKEIFSYDIAAVRAAMEARENSDDLRIQFALKRLKETVSFSNIEKSEINDKFLPEKKRVLEHPFGEEKKFHADEIQNEFRAALEELKIEGWDVTIKDNIAAISVSQEKKQVKIPESRKLTETGLKQLIVHEIETHVLRRENGERSKLKLLGLGLDRYIAGEEGISTYEEQKIGGADEFSGLDGHLAISLALGMDGRKRDFREVFNILRDYFFIKSNEKDLAKAWEKAKNAAWNRCVRTFRGTTCQTTGVCFTRDMVYREGNINTWIVLSGNPDEEAKFSLGKYDPANPRHAWILEQANISEDDLETLEK